MLAALLTPTIAVAGVYFARQQWKTNRNKLKLELFERRYAFYEAAMNHIGTILTSGVATSTRNLDFLVKTRGAQFIVGKEIADYFDKELYIKASLLESLESELKGLAAGPERTENVRQQRELKDWLQEQHKVLDSLFSGMLKLEH